MCGPLWHNERVKSDWEFGRRNAVSQSEVIFDLFIHSLKFRTIMKISNDLVEAIMMLSFIILVLVGTTDFESDGTKSMVMGGIGVVAIIAIVVRVIKARRPGNRPTV